jgi:esterase/lipase superfamily enzyme
MTNNVIASMFYYCKKREDGKLYEIQAKKFFADIKGLEGYTDIVLYIHGFNNFPDDDIFPRAEKLQEMFDTTLKNKKALIIPVIWPCNNQIGIIRDYSNDQDNADASALAMARAFQKFVEHTQDGVCNKRINILAHSMGNRVLRETLTKLKYDIFPKAMPQVFRNIFMIAADVVNETLHNSESGNVIVESCRNCVVYYANDDLALNSSKIINLKDKIVSKRLGHTGVEDMKQVHRKKVHNIDCDDFNNSYDLPKGHSYFLENKKGKKGKVFKHIAKAIDTGRIHSDINNELIL